MSTINHSFPSLKLPGIGPKMAENFAKLGIFSLKDLLLHLPIRYQDRTKIQPIRSAVPGEEIVIEGKISNVTKVFKGKTKVIVQVTDESSASIYLRFFHINKFQIDKLSVGSTIRCYGIMSLGTKGKEMMHPEYKVFDENATIVLDKYLTAFYPATMGLSQHMLRKFIDLALALMPKDKFFTDMFPEVIRQDLQIPSLQSAIQFLHKPNADTDIQLLLDYKTPAHKRLIFEELLAHRLSFMKIKSTFKTHQSPVLLSDSKNILIKKFSNQLDFEFTGAQKKVIAEINQDLSKPHPMLRLLQGDVGSGKTVVAAIAMLQAIINGYQAALMVPTELLAEQHYQSFAKWMNALDIKTVFLSGNVKGKARAAVLAAIANGEAQVIIGTHALFQKEVEFFKLALIVIDEQHRFGVEQRATMREKGMQLAAYPHQLLMTATPIPRTLAMSFYADLDCSIIDELPPGRTPIVTIILADAKRNEIISRIKKSCEEGKQAYWVCPLIDESDLISCQAATKTAEDLTRLLPSLKIGLVHGRMKSSAKEATMAEFKEGKINLLVATTVIEVGVDVPNASLMIIENAERLGLSQLHQLRGRVGRGKINSFCVLLYQSPLSEFAKKRLEVMRETTDGFKIAEYDLELRGPGEVLGTKQTGAINFRIADLLRDSSYLPLAQRYAQELLLNYPELVAPLIERWVDKNNDFLKV